MSTDGERVAARRERLTLDKKELAEMAGVSRDTVADIEAGKGFRRSTLTKIERVLDKIEAEAGLPPLAEGATTTVVDAHASGLVTYRVRIGALDVDVTVQGPVENIADLEASVQRLLNRAESPGGASE